MALNKCVREKDRIDDMEKAKAEVTNQLYCVKDSLVPIGFSKTNEKLDDLFSTEPSKSSYSKCVREGKKR